MIEQECAKAGVGDSSTFNIEIYNLGGTNCPRWDVVVSREPTRSEHPTAIRHSLGQFPRDVVRQMVTRLCRTQIRTRQIGSETEGSMGDPGWTLSCHRMITELMQQHEIPMRHPHWTLLRDAIRNKLPMIDFVLGAGRMHPRSMRISPKGVMPPVYVGVDLASPDPRTCLLIDVELPQTIMVACAGKRLVDVFPMTGVTATHTIHQLTYNPATGIRIELEHDDVFIDDRTDGARPLWSSRD